MAIITELRKALEGSNLTFEELRAFELGLQNLTKKEQSEFLDVVTENPELIYPLYINYKAKLHAISSTDKEWEAVIEKELEELDELIEKRRVGDELF
ncbi:MAG: hypothetical protein KBC21_01115 [Candidatus Pacebacteria bacterium]|nr:hypothetical protein [Candidatus Paceibacterota bacterium]